MTYTVRLTPQALDDITEATAWYNKQKPNLGNRFFVQLADTIDYLNQNPKLFPKKYKNIRQALVNQFPFKVHYILLEKSKEVIVLAILHASRNPKIWKNRKPL